MNSIDTPGVIDRVSTLFRGHPSLIQGFNTFLPPGYRIECVVTAPNEAGASNTITVTTPMGVTIRTQDVTGLEAMEFVRNQPRADGSTAGTLPTTTPSPLSTPQQQQPAQRIPISTSLASSQSAQGSNSTTPSGKEKELLSGPKAYHLPTLPPSLPDHLPALPNLPLARPASPSVVAIPPYRGPSSKSSIPSSSLSGPPRTAPQDYSLGPGNRQQHVVAPTPTVPHVGPIPRPRIPSPDNFAAKMRAKAEENAMAAALAEAGPPTSLPAMEFNHAINYVNKIKNRFTKDPETYKTFLEILQTYQKETRPIQEVCQFFLSVLFIFLY